MKHLLLLASFVILLTYKASAQQSVQQVLKGSANAVEPSLTAKEAIKLVGKVVYVSDIVCRGTFINDTLKVLYLRSRKPQQSFAIILKGEIAKVYSQASIGRRINVSGKVITYQHRPAILVTNASQLGTRIQI
jgi:hypothetical protein